MNANDRHLLGILEQTKAIAMIGVSSNVIRPSYFVGRYLSNKGYRVHPVNPAYAGQNLFGAEIHHSLKALRKSGAKVDMVDIFRRSSEAQPIVEDALKQFLERGLKTIWMQIGVQNDKAAAIAEREGVTVIMNRCPKIEYQRLYGELSIGGFNSGVITSRLRPIRR